MAKVRCLLCTEEPLGKAKNTEINVYNLAGLKNLISFCLIVFCPSGKKCANTHNPKRVFSSRINWSTSPLMGRSTSASTQASNTQNRQMTSLLRTTPYPKTLTKRRHSERFLYPAFSHPISRGHSLFPSTSKASRHETGKMYLPHTQLATA